ncbi:MAG: efflux RND transporter periplasmic adaptor subunit [Pseudomonadota bacterium]
MKKLLSIAAPVLVIGIGVAAYALLDWTKPEPDKKQDPVRPLSVFVQPAKRAEVALGIETSGEVRARTTVEMIAQVAGRIVSVSPEFVEGGRVSPQAVLVKIEDTDYRLALTQAQAAVADAEVGVEQALADADVARKQLRDARNATALALKKPQVARAQSRLLAAQASLEQAQINLDRTRISLPFDGRVVAKQVDVGQYVTPGVVLGRAFATDVVEVRLPLTDAQLASLGLPIGYVAEDAGVPVVLSAQVAGQQHRWQAHLVRLDAAIEPTTRMLYGIVEMHDPYAANVSAGGMPLAVGLYVQAALKGRQLERAIVIPRDALRAGNQVFVVNDQDRLEVRQVDVTHSDRKQAVVASGLAVQEQVVVSSIRNPIDGMALQALNSEATSDSQVAAQSQAIDTTRAGS